MLLGLLKSVYERLVKAAPLGISIFLIVVHPVWIPKVERAMDATERVVRTWMGSGRDIEIQETVLGMLTFFLKNLQNHG